ncbi:MAG: GTP-binding protein [Promethearchaeota archaeon]|nr:MAG: GTP-binding protein [Candidatus Lokiarchaeota archaeon]
MPKTPKSCIFKIIMGGSAKSGKTTFLNGTYFPYNEEEFFHIGVSFKLIDCLVNNEDTYLLQIWDFKVMNQFRCLYPSFCKGAKGALLCFDVTDRESFNELHYWIKIIRKISGKIPIILIGTKNELNRIITDEEIDDLMEMYQINGIFFTSLDDLNRENVFKELISQMSNISQISKFNIFLPEFDKDFEKFIDYFSICVLCGRKLHFNYLKRFYYSTNQTKQRLRAKLIELMEMSNEFDDLFYHHIDFGIPCCKCYELIFKDNQ